MTPPPAANLLRLADLVLYRSVERNDAEQERLVGRLLLNYVACGDHAEVLTVFADTFPELDRILRQFKPGALTAVAQRAWSGRDPWAESALRAEAAARISALVTDPVWRACGLPSWYALVLRRLDPEADYPFVARTAEGEPRVQLSTASWRRLLPGFQGIEVEDDIADALLQCGVVRPDVRARGRLVHVPLYDAALLLDLFTLEELADRLIDPSWQFVRRLDGQTGALANAVVLPVEACTRMRGIARLVGRAPSVEDCAEACAQRLRDRGVDEPIVWPVVVDDTDCVATPTFQARILMAPAVVGEVAGRLSMTRPEYDCEATGYSPANGAFLIQAAELAYRDAGLIRAYTTAWGFVDADGKPTAAFFEDERLDAQAFAAFDAQKNVLLVAFRGTDSPTDLIADVRIDYEDGWICGGGQVFAGFHQQFVALLPMLRAYLERRGCIGPDPPKLLCAGHSLGGALAVLFTAWCMHNDIPVAQLYTAGQPRPGDAGFARRFERRLAETGTPFFRYVNGYDIIPFTPPHSIDVGTPVFIDRNGHVHDPRGKVPRSVSDYARRILYNLRDGLADHNNSLHLALIRKSYTGGEW